MMSPFAPQYQIVSDLHLETPIRRPLYKTFQLHIEGTHVFLLGDIGLAKDDGLFAFLRSLLESARGSRFFYVLGNHELYQFTLRDAIQRLRDFEEEAKNHFGGRFILLNRKRYDVDQSTTILGCTLWTAILPDQAVEAYKRLTDFNEERGIREWSMERHLEAHREDLAWLNAQVNDIRETEPLRQIIIATHHSPTLDLRSMGPQHHSSSVSSGFATDLSRELCWTTPSVKLWAFGHTHYNCGFHDDVTGKLIVANQRGYAKAKIKSVVVVAAPGSWMINTFGSQVERKTSTPPGTPSTATTTTKRKADRKHEDTTNRQHRSLLDCASDRIPGFRRLRTSMSG